jgi:ADP-heptose:LPS heptosyltransferase
VVLTGGPEAARTGPTRHGVIDLTGATTLRLLADVIAGADAVVTGNTGPAHLSAAVGTPVVSVYAPTVPAQRWHPWRVPHVLLGDQNVECAGCHAAVCIHPTQSCVAGVTATDVTDAVEQLVARVDAEVA